jgi:hypothetical protein
MIPMNEQKTRDVNENEMNRRRFRKGTSAVLVAVLVVVVMAVLVGYLNTHTSSNEEERISNKITDRKSSSTVSVTTFTSSANGETEIEIEIETGTSSSASASASTVSPTRQDYEPRCNQHQHDYEAPEPFRYLHDCCDDCNPPVPESPDPLVSVTWNLNKRKNSNKESSSRYQQNPNRQTNSNNKEVFVGTPLQIYRTLDPVALYTIPSDASVVVTHRETQSTNTKSSTPRLLILANCTVVMDWGSERAAWFEVQSHDDLVLNDSTSSKVKVTASISEYNRPYPGKTRPLQKYGNHTYRLETNEELYEGVRFTFLHVSFPNNAREEKEEETATTTTTTANANANGNANANANTNANENTVVAIDDFSIVSKVKPIEYTGSFRSSRERLTKAWYWGAYGARLNVEQSQINSILIERGDRVAIQGDGHPTIATVLAVFYSDETSKLLTNVLNATDNAHKHVVDDGIMAYPLYWCLSAMDYYWATYNNGDDASQNNNNNNADSFTDQHQLVSDIRVLLDKRIDDFLDPNLDITWFGWDDRVGNGWCFHSKDDACTREGLLSFAGLVIMVCNDLVGVLKSLVVLLLDDDENEIQKGDAEQMKKLVETYESHTKNMTAALRNVPEYPSGFGVHAAANAINGNVATEQEIEQYWMGNTADGNDTLNNAVTICSFSQFNQYWILQALGNMGGGNNIGMGGIEHALKSIDLCWGPMMELSTGGCFWELSSREWLTFMNEGDQAPHLPSYCHPWASGVTPWLSKLMGGTLPFRPGYSEFVALPYVSETYLFVNSTTPTPHGPITVSARLSPPPRKQKNEEQQSPSKFQFQFEATIDANVPGFFGLRKAIIIQKSSSSAETTSNTTNTTKVPLKMETVKVNGIPIANHEILDAEQASTLFEGSGIGGNNHPRTKEHFFFRLGENDGNGSDSGSSNNSGGGSYVVTAHYQIEDSGSGRGAALLESDNVAAIRHRSLSNTIIIHTSTDDDDFSPFPIPSYPSGVIEPVDGESQGDGLLHYGRDGYLLLGCNGNGNSTDADTYTDTYTDIDRLPAYIKNVTIRQHGYPGWVVPEETLVGYSDTDPVYLPLSGDRNNNNNKERQKQKRVLGMVGIDDQGGGDINCILVDVKLAALSAQLQHSYFLSIYFVAIRPENKHAIRVMDGDTLDVIAPTTLIDDYTGGVWWTLRTDRSVRLKMMDIEGIHLSAISFATDLSPS